MYALASCSGLSCSHAYAWGLNVTMCWAHWVST